MKKYISILFALLLLTPVGLAAQDHSAAINVRGGLNVPTFDVTDLADAGPSFGAGIAIPLNDRLFARANVDLGFHDGAGPVEGGDVNVNHYIAGLGLKVVEPTERSPWRVSVNAGAGIMTFDVEAADGTSILDNKSYFAINVGGEVEYVVSETVSLLLSPQGDIAFTDEDDGFTGSTAWVWPITAGAKFYF